jgi:AcrR family transcriptional regulator
MCNKLKSKLAESKQRHQDERRGVLMDAAAKVMAKKGIRSTTMDDIAASLDMTKIILYRTFATKDKLIESVLERITDEFLLADAQNVYSIEEEFGQRIRRYLQVLRNQEDSMNILLLQTPHDAKYNKQFKKLTRKLVKRTTERIEQRRRQPESTYAVDAKFCGEVMASFILDAMARWLSYGSQDKDHEFIHWLVTTNQTMGSVRLASNAMP